MGGKMKQVALIGLGMVSDTYAQAIRNSRCVQLKYVLSQRAETALAFTKKHPDLGANVATIETILNDPSVDFVILATPPNARRTFIDACAAAQMPILMEKPIERNLDAASELVEKCETANIPLGIVFQHRMRPIVNTLSMHLHDLGMLGLIEVSVPWWRPQSYYDIEGRGTYARDGGGVLINQAIHTLDLMLMLCGPVTHVSAMAATTQFHNMEAEDIVTAGLQFENGAIGTLFATTASYPGKGETITLHGTQASAHLDAGMLTLSYRDGRVATFGSEKSSGAGADPMAFTSDWHQSIIDDFAAALDHKRPPRITGRDALHVHRLISVLERAAREKRHVTLST